MSDTNIDEAVLRVERLEIGLHRAKSVVPLVTGVDLAVSRRQVLGLVGESGSGKSLTSLAIARLLDGRALRVTGGSVRLAGRDLLLLPESAMNAIRGNDIGVIFQDPMTSLDPAFTIGYQIASVLRRHTDLKRQSAHQRAIELMALVGIGDPARRVDQYAHQLSGGMRQRAMIAIAIACEPKLLIADEPTTALDATTQAQILELIKDLSQTLGMSTIITTHDLGVVADVCDTVAVMYAGQIVEQGTTEQIFYRPQHPYTERLLRSLPRVGVVEDIAGIPGTPPTAGRYPVGCRFAARCEFAMEPDCTTGPINLEHLGDAQCARCVRVHNLALRGVLS
jgi:oligopeptide/dipeptide ABC transporter ATP-binding protein